MELKKILIFVFAILFVLLLKPDAEADHAFDGLGGPSYLQNQTNRGTSNSSSRIDYGSISWQCGLTD